jgi:glycosyltransferase involved in cell wall biosynthesis
VIFAAEAMQLQGWPRHSYVVFAGSGTAEYPGYASEIRERLRSVRSPYEVHERVDRSTMARMLRAADVCVIPSLKEATSLSALEAMASCTVVVAARTGGLPEIVRDGDTGYLHDVASPVSILESVRRALDAEPTVVDQAFHQVNTAYSWHTVAERVRAAYEVGRT